MNYGGAKTVTKHEDLLKVRMDENFENTRIEIAPQLVDNTLHLCAPECVHFDSEVEAVVAPKKHVVKTKMAKKTQLEKVTHYLYDLENCHTVEKVIDIDLDLYQMEDY
jgi:hypothetical protein